MNIHPFVWWRFLPLPPHLTINAQLLITDNSWLWIKIANGPGNGHFFVIDVHTGLGKWQQNSLFHNLKGTDNRDFPEEIRRNIFISNDDINIAGYKFKGAHADLYRQILNDAKVDFFTQEFGTYAGVKVLKALRAENQYHHYGVKDINSQVKRALKEAFYPN